MRKRCTPPVHMHGVQGQMLASLLIITAEASTKCTASSPLLPDQDSVVQSTFLHVSANVVCMFEYLLVLRNLFHLVNKAAMFALSGTHKEEVNVVERLGHSEDMRRRFVPTQSWICLRRGIP